MSQAKTNARKCAVQALYQWQMSGESLIRIETYFLEEEHLKGAQKTYFSELFHGVPKQLAVIDAALAEFVDRPVEKIDPVERAILRIGAYELMNRLETPYKVIINEGVNLAKDFGADGSHKYVNGILDKVAQKQRAVEIAAKQAKSQN
ncbi:transcription antitermination factor NusB [Methylomonas sp. BW4-1]|uniref:Transcription antitermination protein NusB n=1 Tax=Methylomonas defluvii TaxID=3045149 RepID=A0ABU4UBF6_9GAMM|nr:MULTISPECIES: transcription antitermination factor NusB [unclassified Methylomonas]MDX8126669.1 transcription antitermination factor NusB [Methylomonas sp. OY6]NOV29466.1 transcription antitermination factor NusB [Methylomonas sp. ZR1]PKD40671.1 transcription antitermination factor NusB [Methylomonas sp. Kb3]QBC27627.1 transcription antitermination factor NusB [Methylomonas sp. LW13]QSB03423.1 transcription antitermination factor NusB [Methylomonas sp. EFPC1]